MKTVPHRPHEQARVFLAAIPFLWAALVLTTGLPCADNAAWGAEKKYKTIGYVAGWKGLDITTIAAEKLTHINYAFANVIDGEVAFGSEKDKIDQATLNAKDLELLNALKAKNPDLKILISVGGWTWSKDFSDAALTNASREKFAISAVRLLKNHRLDGVDIDWEYPGQIGDNNKFRPEDKQNFTLLLKAVREHLDRQSDQDGRRGEDRYLLTIASGADTAYTDNTNLGEAHKHLDFINIMTYDFHSGLHYVSGHHANLYRSEMAGASASNIEDSVNGHVNAGVPVEKIVLGIPFYGRFWKGVPDVNHGLYQKGTTTGSIVSYKAIVEKYESDPSFAQFWDAVAQAPWLFSTDAATVISYETPRSLKRKIEYLKEKGLGGVMFWEYANDYDTRLLKTIDAALNQ
jgi:chitinase